MSMQQLKIKTQITDRTAQSVDMYLQEIGKIPLLSPEEEVRLAIRIHQGDQRAYDKMIVSNLRFAVSVAKQYQYQGLDLADLINNANLGLMVAARRFDETRGFKFISFAVGWIRQAILDALSKTARIVRLPQNKIGTHNKATKEINRFEHENEREPSVYELSDLLDIDVDDAIEISSLNIKSVSIDAPLTEDSETSMADIMEDDNALPTDANIMRESLREEIRIVMGTLTEKERDALAAYFGLYGEDWNVESVMDKYDVTREGVRTIKDRAILKLRKSSRSDRLKPYLGIAA